MIFLHNNKNKIYLTFILALVTFVGIIVVWQKLNVFSIAVSQPEIKNEEPSPKSIVKELQNDLELTKLEWDDAQAELLKSQKQQELLAATKEYLKNKSTSTATSTAATNVK
jgi:hypothetical protein